MKLDLNGANLFPEMHDRLVEAYSQLAKETGGDVAPVGVAWNLSYESMPDLQLHADDHSHAQEHGAYLTALVLFSTLFDEDPVNMPRKLVIQNDQTRSYEIRFDSKIRRHLEATAQKACKEYEDQ